MLMVYLGSKIKKLDLQRHIKTQHETNETPGQENQRTCEINPQHMVFVFMWTNYIETDGFGVSWSCCASKLDDRRVGFLQERDSDEACNTANN